MSIEATREQRAARDVFASGADLALVAGAGTGKTSTLIMMAAATSKQGLYMAFNKTDRQLRETPVRQQHGVPHRPLPRLRRGGPDI